MAGDQLREIIEGNEDFLGLVDFIKNRGFDISLIVCLGVGKREEDEETGDKKFLKDLKIRYE